MRRHVAPGVHPRPPRPARIVAHRRRPRAPHKPYIAVDELKRCAILRRREGPYDIGERRFVLKAVVGVQDAKHVARRPEEALVHRVVDARVWLARPGECHTRRTEPCLPTPQEVHRAIRRPAIHHLVVQLHIPLMQHALQRRRKGRGGVVADGDDGDFHKADIILQIGRGRRRKTAMGLNT